jgi:glycine hydroxymethyltransferase
MAEECRALTVWICDVLDHLGDADVEAQVGRQAAQLCALPYYSFQHETQKRVLDTG